MTEQHPVQLNAYCEFKPIRGEFEFTVYFVDPMGNKQRYEFDLPMSMIDNVAFGGYEAWDHRIIIDAKYDPKKDMDNAHRPPIYEQKPPPTDFFDYMNRFVISLSGKYADPNDPDRVAKFIAEKPERETFSMEWYQRDKEDYKKRYEKWLETEAKAKELGMSDEEAGIRRLDKTKYPE